MLGRPTSSRRSISKEVSMGLILTILLVSTISFFIAYSVARTKAHEQLNAKADEYIQYLKEILILPIWNYDYETIDVIGKSFMQNDFIAGITIVDSRNKTCVAEQKKNVVPLVKRSVKLTYYGQPMGAVEITLASGYFNIWNRQFLWYFSFIILINLLSLIIMSGFLLRWSLNKPLQLLSRIVASYSSGKKGQLPEHIPYSEFVPLTDTLQRMGNEIQLQMGELQQAEKKYRSIFENATEGIFQSTLDGKIINANPAFAEILGYDTPEQLVSQVRNIGKQHYIDPEQRYAYIRTLKTGKVVKAFEVEFKRKDGRVIWVSLNALPIYNPSGELLHIEGLVQDITTRKKAQIELTRLSTAVEQVAETIIITDDTGRIKYVNPAFERNTGYLLDKIYNEPNSVLGADPIEMQQYDEILSAVKKDEVWTGRLTSKKKNNEPLIEDVIVSPIKSPTGKFLGYVSINRDVTLKARYEDQVRQSQKMEAIGTLAGGIAHDFNNILGVIIGCSGLVRNSLPKNDKAVKDIEQILTAGLRAKSLVNQILTFSRQEETKKIPLTLSPFIKEVIRFLKATLPNYIKIKYTKRTESGIVLADPIQIQQILMNICTNASQAIGQSRGEIEVSLSKENFTERSDLPPEIEPGHYVVIEIKDDGPGIEENIQHKVFDPFFTTKGVGEGTGLGLSVVHGIVKQHDGAVILSNADEKGACFSILLPRLEHKDIKITTSEATELPTGNEKILLVDDEKALLDVLNRIISNLGYDVEAYHDSTLALEAFTRKTDYFDLLITDQVMPDLTGTQLVNEVRAKNTDIPVILLTGLDEVRLEKTEFHQPRFEKILKKPLLNSELSFAIRKVIDEQQNR